MSGKQFVLLVILAAIFCTTIGYYKVTNAVKCEGKKGYYHRGKCLSIKVIE